MKYISLIKSLNESFKKGVKFNFLCHCTALAVNTNVSLKAPQTSTQIIKWVRIYLNLKAVEALYPSKRSVCDRCVPKPKSILTDAVAEASHQRSDLS